MSLTPEQTDEIVEPEALKEAFVEDALAAYAAKEEAVGEAAMRELERVVMLNIIEGIDKYASVTLHMPPPHEIPMPVKLLSSSSEKITASPSLIATAR